MQQSNERAQKSRRVSLSARRKEIEKWVGEGCTDEWIADALGTTRSSVQSFRSRNRIMRHKDLSSAASGSSSGGASGGASATSTPPEERDVSGTQPSIFEGVLDQGEEGYGLWLDPAIADDPLFLEEFAGVSDVRVVIERGRIVLEPAPDQSAASEEPPDQAETSDTTADRQTTTNEVRSRPEKPRASTGSRGEPGRIKFFDAYKGYGFITRPDGGEIFFHHSELRDAKELESGEYVLYEPGSSQRGPVARAVRTTG